jgi:hypothetical protein
MRLGSSARNSRGSRSSASLVSVEQLRAQTFADHLHVRRVFAMRFLPILPDNVW